MKKMNDKELRELMNQYLGIKPENENIKYDTLYSKDDFIKELLERYYLLDKARTRVWYSNEVKEPTSVMFSTIRRGTIYFQETKKGKGKG